MSKLQSIALEFGGVARTSEFRARGIGAGLLFSAAGRGELIRVRKGWYAHPSISHDAVRAVRVGGALACISAAKHFGVWTPPGDEQLHVAVPSHSVRLRTPDDRKRRLADVPDGTVVHWMPRVPRVVQGVGDALVCAVRCSGHEVAFVLLESAWHLRLVDAGKVAAIRARVPRDFRQWLDLAGPHAESGTESLLKLLLIQLGLTFRQQVRFDGVGRVDFLVGENLVIEVDSREHHSDPTRDRQRDAVLSARGYRVLRFIYSQLVYDREQVIAAVLGAVARGDAVAAHSF